MALGKTTATLAHGTLVEARDCTDSLFRLVPADTWYSRPVPERHRLLFYLGHLDAFDWNLISRYLDLGSCHVPFDSLFAFGIDPKPGQLPEDKPSDWPSLEEVRKYVRCVRERLDEVLQQVTPILLDVAIEHRFMHAETFTYLLHDLDKPMPRQKPWLQGTVRSSICQSDNMVDVPAGIATLGQTGKVNDAGELEADEFGWDNEFGVQRIEVPAFQVDKHKVTNRQYLTFVETGAAPPYFWRRRRGEWLLRTFWGEIRLPLDWPVYVTHREAQAYARWIGKSLPSEAQFHRAAYGTTNGEERRFPWGDAEPDPQRGNFNFFYWNPIPVTANPLGESAFGVAQLMGNGWEWTRSTFSPLPDFRPFPFYPGYSAPFFDGEHYVLKGGSPRTAARLLRRSYRNWFRPDYRYVYAGFRCVEN